MAVTKHCCIIR